MQVGGNFSMPPFFLSISSYWLEFLHRLPKRCRLLSVNSLRRTGKSGAQEVEGIPSKIHILDALSERKLAPNSALLIRIGVELESFHPQTLPI